VKAIKRIAIYGNKGMLGHDLTEVLTEDYEIIGFDIENIDITDSEQVLKSVSQYLPDVVINCAAYTDVDGCETHTQKAFATNADGNLFLAQACHEYQVKLFFISTDYVFNGKKEDAYSEEDEPDPLNIYGKSKLKGEKYLVRTTKDFICIRTSGLYGINGKNFVKRIIAKAKSEGKLRVVNDQRCCPTYTRDLAKVMKKLLKTDYKGFLNVVNPEGCTWFEFAREIIDLAGLHDVSLGPITSAELALPAPRPANSVLSVRKLKDEIGITMRNRVDALSDFMTALKGASSL